jgi:hypothetical protein
LKITLYTVAIEEGTIQIVPGAAHIDQAPIKNIDDVHVAPVVGIPYEKYREMFGGIYGYFEEFSTCCSINGSCSYG